MGGEEEHKRRREEGYNANWGEAKKRIAEKENGAQRRGSKIKKRWKIEKTVVESEVKRGAAKGGKRAESECNSEEINSHKI